jgi:tRNA pseudouridine55 synthase
MPAGTISGILNVNKPGGWTSHDVVARVRRIAGVRKVGHAGTLDPMATGVLLLCLGQATRISEYLMDSEKAYAARLRLGIATDTYDADGEVTSQADATGVSRADVVRELKRLVGRLDQLPPMYSAVKYDGIPLYRLARQGKTVARQPRQVEILAADLVKWSPPEAEIQVRCGKGTYVRSLAHELGQRLGCGAHLTRLTRTASGSFQIAQAHALEEIAQAFEEGRGAELILPMDLALQAFPAETVDSSTANKIISGEQIRLSSVVGAPSRSGEEGTLRRAYTEDGQFIALLRSQGDHLWRPHKVFTVSPR